MPSYQPTDWTTGQAPHRYIAQGIVSDMLEGKSVLYLARTQIDARATLNLAWHFVLQAKRAAACTVRNSRTDSLIRYDRGGQIRFSRYAPGYHLRGHSADVVLVQAAPADLEKQVWREVLPIGPLEFLGRPLA